MFLYEDSLLDIKKSRETFIARLTQLFVLIFIGLEHFCVIKIVPPFLVIRSARGDPSGELRICLLNLCIFQWPLKLGRNHDSPSQVIFTDVILLSIERRGVVIPSE